MRFDNAFLTVNGDVGMQMVDNGQTFSVWKDKRNNIQVSEQATATQKAAALSIYHKRLNQYMPKKAL